MLVLQRTIGNNAVGELIAGLHDLNKDSPENSSAAINNETQNDNVPNEQTIQRYVNDDVVWDWKDSVDTLPDWPDEGITPEFKDSLTNSSLDNDAKQYAITAVEQLLLETDDIQIITDRINTSGRYNITNDMLSKIKQYNFNSSSIMFTAENFIAWVNLRKGIGTVADLRYIIHEATEINELEAENVQDYDFKGRYAEDYDYTSERFGLLTHNGRVYFRDIFGFQIII